MPLTRHRRSVPSGGAPVARHRAPGLVLSLLVALVGVLGGLTAVSTSVGPAAATGSCAGPLGTGQIRVVLVVDPGETGPRGPMATCLVVAAGTSGSKILAQRASELGLPAPRYAGSGLLCGLDGFPATACPVNNGGSFAFWAYFNGSDSGWSFGLDNPFVRRMVDGEIMGWRYTTGSTEGDAPAPRIAPGRSLFPALTPAATTPPAPAPTAAPAPGGPTGAPGAVGGGGSAATDPTGAPVDPSATTDPAGGDGAAADPASTTADGIGSTDASTQAEELAAAPASSSSATGRWVGLAVAVAAVGALAFGAVTRSRSRRP